MKFFHKYSIKNKLMIIILGITFFTLCIGFIINLFDNFISDRDDLKSNADINARLIGVYCVVPLTFDYKNEADLVLQKLENVPNVINACVWDQNNNVFSSFNRFKNEMFSFPSPLENTTNFNNGYLHIFHPILVDNEKYGTVYLRVSTNVVYKKILYNVITAFFILILLSFLTYFLANKFQKIISEPILKLANVTKELAETGDYSVRVFSNGHDEVSELYERFNHMISEIENRSAERDKAVAEIKNLNEQLEEKVRHRTIELRKLSVAIEQSPTSIIITDVNGSIEYVNPYFTSLTGYTLDEVKGKNPRILKAEGLPYSKYVALWKTISSGKTWRGDLKNKKKNGEVIWEMTSISPIINDQKEITHYLAVKEDITSRIKYEKMLDETKKAAEAANQAKSVFLANMSHELRTPLNAILGFTQIIRKDNSLSEIHKKNLTTIHKSGEHLRELINDVLEMSKIEAGRTKLNPKKFNFYTLLQDLEAMFKVRTDVKKLELEFEIDSSVPEYLEMDDGKLRQILINLLGNAVKFTQVGKISLTVFSEQLENDYVKLKIEVIDTGIGIKDSEMDKIFNYFEQVGTQVKADGTGLGLSISKEYAHMLEGEITVESEYGTGSIFKFEFNAKKISNANMNKNIIQRKVISISKTNAEFKILIVDDRESNRDLLSQLLQSIGCKIKEAVNGIEAIELFQSWNPDMILMDMIMPLMNGFDAIRKIRLLPMGKSIPIIAITASVMEEQTEEVIKCGANDIIRKPIDEEELYEKMKQHSKIEFEYEDTKNGKDLDTQLVDTVKLVKELSVIPDDFRKEIIQEIKLGYKKKILHLIEKLQLKNDQFVAHLKMLCNSYKFEKLLKLFEDSDK